ncbi:MAG: peroxiredoxin [Candidatus Babeliales bacterium]|nr:peroxiredoxin [Candidatus Babeliales bacterium]
MNFIFLGLAIIVVFGIFQLYEKSAENPLKLGQAAPRFSLPDETGKLRSLDEFKRKKVVLYFYPKDETSGCTAQACQLRDNYDIYKQNDIVILGVSYDSPASHAKFKANQHLPFTLLSDSKKEVAHLYGADKIIGNFVPQRKTFLINEQGRIVYMIENVDIANHSQEILKAFGIKN